MHIRTKEQIKRTTKAISGNEEIKDQIRSSRDSRDATYSAYVKDDTEFKKLVDEVANE